MLPKHKNATLICDMQFGSTGKGLIAGYLAKRDKPDVLVTSWSMNAGHTFIERVNDEQKVYIHCMLANGIVSPKLRHVLLGPGSQIGLLKLKEEVTACAHLLRNSTVLIHENATIIQDRHVQEEQQTMLGIGSTAKGCGSALIEKVKRSPKSKIVAHDFKDTIKLMFADCGAKVQVVSKSIYNAVVDNAERVQIEGAQGFSLGINNGFYPYTTSRECTPAQILSDCAVPIGMLGKVVGCMRTYPIRVANRHDAEGNMVGWSGPSYPDQREITFKGLNQEQELTTVTKLPRRIFEFSQKQSWEAMRQVRPDEVFLNFANYCNKSTLKLITEIINLHSRTIGCGGVKFLGYGPAEGDVVNVSEEI